MINNILIAMTVFLCFLFLFNLLIKQNKALKKINKEFRRKTEKMTAVFKE